MSNHSWTEDQIKKLAGNNLLRVFSKVEKVIIINEYTGVNYLTY
jgi:hypothetical protein